ncbi:tape measure protein [Seonamhaeicola sp.]|uniref:tape measure protein n=1 Tax=Seonamhaeicola sp. TaxID=1912245 RepID=UPI003569AFFF
MAKNPITVLEEGNKLLNELEQKLIGVNTNLLEISKTARNANLKDYFSVKAPNEVNEKLKLQKTIIAQLNAEVKERDRLEKALSNQLAKNKLAESDLLKELVKQRFETTERNKQIKASAILSSSLATEYQKLVVRMNQAGSSVQNLTAKQAQGIKLSNKEQAELKQSQIEFKKYQTAVTQADASIGRFQRNVGNYQSALGKAALALRNFAGVFGVFSAGLIAKEIFELTKEIDGLDKALLQVTETQDGFNQAQLFLKDLAEEAGVDILGLQKSYTKFFAAAKTTNLTLAETQDIFRQTAKAGAVLGLSTDDINGSMKALEQILSKGKVQAEEIRGQLGERLPGAFQILAKSMGLTTAQLSKQLELGNVLSDEVLPGFAKELAKTYSLDAVNRVNTLTASQNRLGNSWTDFVRSLDGSQGTLTKIFSFVIDGLASIVKGFTDINTSVDDFNKKISSNAVTQQASRYKELGDEATIYAEIDKKLATERIANLKKEKEEQEKVLESFKQYNAFQKWIRPDARNAQLAIEKLNASIATQEGVLRAAKIQLGEITEETKKNTVVEEENNETKQKTITALVGSLAYLRNEIKLLEEKREKLATNSREYEAYTKQIGKAKDALSLFMLELEGVSEIKSLDDTEAALKRITDILTKTKTIEGLENSGFDDIQLRIDANIEAEERIRDEAKKTSEYRKELEQNLAYALVDFTNTIFDAKIEKYELEIDANNEKYDKILDAENLTEEQRTALEAERDRKNEELEKKKKEQLKKQAIFNKATALAEIAINTSVAITKTLGQTGFFGIPLTTVVAALGALQAATVIATPIPQYAEGKNVNDNYEGAAIWGEKKQEVKISKDGSIEFSPKRIANHLTHVKKDDVILPDASKFISSLSDEQLYNDIHRYSILASMQGQTNALNAMMLTKSIDNQTDRLIKAIKSSKPKINLHNNNSIGRDLKFLTRLNNTL